MTTQPHVIDTGISYKTYIVISPEDRNVRLLEGTAPTDIRREVILTPDSHHFLNLPKFWQDYVRKAWVRMGVNQSQ